MTPIITRKIALKTGRVHYFTGRPCCYGHISERMTKSRYCLACAGIRDKSPARRAWRSRWFRTPKGVEQIRRRAKTPKGREHIFRRNHSVTYMETTRRYNQTPKAREKQFRYRHSEKGQDAQDRANSKRRKAGVDRRPDL